METKFVPVALDIIEDAVRKHLVALPAPIDSYAENHILASMHYSIVIAEEVVGFASIYEGKSISQFALDAPYRRHGQELFAQLRQLEQVQSALVPTCDEFFLVQALDQFQQLSTEAYIFAVVNDHLPAPAPAVWALRPAEQDDAEYIRQQSGKIYEPIEQNIADRKIFVTLRQGQPAGFGFLDPSSLHGKVASLGMLRLRASVGMALGQQPSPSYVTNAI